MAMLTGWQAAQHAVGEVRGAGNLVPVLSVGDTRSRPR